MEAIQKTFDDLVTSFAAVSTEVKAATEEMHGFRKQMEDYGTDLDGIKRRLIDADRPGAPPRIEVPQRNKAALTNNGAPLLTTPVASTSTFHTAPSSPQ